MSLVRRPWTPLQEVGALAGSGWPRPYDCKAKSHHPHQELEERCQALEGYQAFREASNKKRSKIFVMGPATRALAIQQIQRLLEFLGDKDPMVVIGFAPPYYPSMNCRF